LQFNRRTLIFNIDGVFSLLRRFIERKMDEKVLIFGKDL